MIPYKIGLLYFKNFEPPRLRPYGKWVAQWNARRGDFGEEPHIWQYSAKGQIAGIPHEVDRNISYVDYAAGEISAPAKPAPPVFTGGTAKAGDRLLLRTEPLYATAAAKTASGSLTGSYWIYDGQVQNGRLRVTNSPRNVGKAPIAQYATGYIRLPGR